MNPHQDVYTCSICGRENNSEFTTPDKYEKMVSGTDIVESNLHRNLPEHLNSEIVLGTITDIAVAVNWLRSTFLYIRAMKNPKRYGIPESLPCAEIEARLQAMCMRELNGLEKYELIKKTDFAYNVEPTENGKLMARLYIAFETMKLFMKLDGKETIPQLLELICQCHEFSDIHLRIDERNTLNRLNSDKIQETIRFPLKGKIKTKEMKINCLIQASLGSLQIPDISLCQESSKILRVTVRICKALSLYLWQRNWYEGLASALTVTKSIEAKMWENSSHLTRQLPGIGPALSSLLASAGKTSFKSIIESNPRDLERIINKHPPMGNSLQEMARSIPQYSLDLNYQKFSKKLYVCLKLVNYDKIIDPNHTFSLLVAGSNNELLRKEKIRDSVFIQQKGEINFTINILPEMKIEAVTVHVISEKLVGVDVKKVVAICSQYQFLSKEEVESLYSDEESLVSSDKSLDEKSMTMITENKNSNKKPSNMPSLTKNPKEKDKKQVKSKYQTSLHQFAFKSSRQQLKHEKENKNFDNEVSSTQDHIMKHEPLPSTSNPEKICDEYVLNCKKEKRIKIDMEYNWYIKRNLEIHKNKTKDENLAQPLSSNHVARPFQRNNNANSHSLLQGPGDSQICRTDVTKSKSEHGCFEKSRPSVIQNAANFQNRPFKENESGCLKMSSNEKRNIQTFCNSINNTSSQRKPLQLSPHQFLNSCKNLQLTPNDSSKRKRNFFPLFMPLDYKEENMDNKTPIDANESNESCYNKDSTSGPSENNILLSRESVTNPTLSNYIMGETLQNKDYMLKLGMTPDSEEDCEMEMVEEMMREDIRTFQNSLDESTKKDNTDSNNTMSSDTSSQTSELAMMEIPLQVSHQNTSENKEMSYSQLDDLFHDSPPERKSQDVNYIRTGLSIKKNEESDGSLRSLQVDNDYHDMSKNNSSDLSPTFDISDFTKKKIDFGEIDDNEINVLPLKETYLKSDSDSLDEDLRLEQKSLRSDYGDPFAPVHDSATLQRLLGKSRKEDNLEENLSWHRNQPIEFSSQTGSNEDFHTNDDSIDWNKTITSQNSFISSEDHDNTKFCRSRYQPQENVNHNHTTVSEYFHTDNLDLKNSTVKHFFQVQKELDYNRYSVKNNFTQKSNLASKIPHCMAVAKPTEEQQTEKNSTKIANSAPSSHKHSIIFNNAPSPQQIEQFKKNMFQNSIFSQSTSNLKNTKSSDSEGALPRLSHLLFDKKHSPHTPLTNFQTASSLISPVATSSHSFSQERNEEHYRRNIKTNLNQLERSSKPIKSKFICNEETGSSVNSPLNLRPTSLHDRFSMNMPNQRFFNFTGQQNHVLQPLIVQEQHYYNISACSHDKNNQTIIPGRKINPE